MDWFAFLLLILLLSGVALFLLKQLCHRRRSGYNEISTTAACCGDIQICEHGDTETHPQGEGNSSQCLATPEKTTTHRMQPRQLFVKPLRPLQVRPVRASNQIEVKHKHNPPHQGPSTSQTKHQHDPSLASSRTIHDAQDQDLERKVQKSHLHHQHGWQQDFETVRELTSAHDFHGKCGSVNEHFEVGISPDLTIREENYSRDVCCPVCQLPLPNETTSEEQTQQQHFTSTPQVICEDCWLLVGMI